MITNAFNLGAIIVAAAGNGNEETGKEEYAAHYPASYENVVSVCAMSCSGNWGGWATYHPTVDLAAPGDNIYSTIIGVGYRTWDGSSMASPNVASVMGLVWTYYPEWTNEDIIEQVKLSADSFIYDINSEKYTGPIWAEKDDSRITPVGKVLRKYHLDEIPQLYNVCRGQMSIVGPRPERPIIVSKLIKEIPYYTHRLKVKPGITGWAQINGNYDNTMTDVYTKLKDDFYYIENMSILLDIKILFYTIWIVIKGRGQ